MAAKKSGGIDWEEVVRKAKWRPIPGRARNPCVCSQCGFEGAGKLATAMLKIHVRQGCDSIELHNVVQGLAYLLFGQLCYLMQLALISLI